MNEASTTGPTEIRRPVNRGRSGLTRKRQHPEQLEVTVPVAFKQNLGSGDAAHVVIEVRCAVRRAIWCSLRKRTCSVDC